MKIRHALLASLVAAVLPTVAAAQSFTCITNNTSNCASTLAPTLSWSYSGSEFKITNHGATDSFISGVYFDWSSGMGSSLSSATENVAFSQDGKTKVLPSGQNISFVSDASWTADPSPNDHGVHGSNGSITFALAGVSMSDFASGAMRVGIHLQGLTPTTLTSPTLSESFVTAAVPEPETYAMLLAGLGLIGTIARRRTKKYMTT